MKIHQVVIEFTEGQLQEVLAELHHAPPTANGLRRLRHVLEQQTADIEGQVATRYCRALRARMDRWGISPKELARAAGVTQRSLSGWIAKPWPEHLPTADNIARLQRGFDEILRGRYAGE